MRNLDSRKGAIVLPLVDCLDAGGKPHQVKHYVHAKIKDSQDPGGRTTLLALAAKLKPRGTSTEQREPKTAAVEQMVLVALFLSLLLKKGQQQQQQHLLLVLLRVCASNSENKKKRKRKKERKKQTNKEQVSERSAKRV